MSKSPPVFRSISTPLEVTDDALNELGDKLGVPKIVKPAPAPSSVIEAQPENLVSAGGAGLVGAPRELGSKKSVLGLKTPTTFAVPAPQIEKITVELPSYLADALRREGAASRITIRTLVMMGLQSLGFEVQQQDLIPDGRRTHARKAR
jgi:hypothetical protein